MKKTYIQRKILSILRENTGKHFLDSGFAYGRHWQRNQGRKFSFNDDITIDDDGDLLSIPIHIYMDTMFELDDNTAKFNRCLKEYYWTAEAFDILEERFGIEEADYLGSEGNTYNFDNDLSQDFQYYPFEYDGEYYVIFQLHNGADVRGGYCKSQVFKLVDVDYFHLGMNADFYDRSTDEEFDNIYQISEDDRYKFDKDKQCFINKETNEEVYPYSAAMGF